jgi:hypothetical protein
MPERSKVMTQTKRDTLFLQVGGLGRRTNNLCEKNDVQNTSEMLRKGLINRKQSGYKEKDLTFGTRNVRKLFKT